MQVKISQQEYEELLTAKNQLSNATKSIAEQKKTISQKELLIKKQKEDIALLLQHIYAASSEKNVLKEKVPEQMDLWGEEVLQTKETPKENVSYSRKKRSKDQNRKPLPESLPRIEDVIEIPESERTCMECNSELKEISEDKSEELVYIPAKVYVRVIRRKKYACSKDSLHGLQRARLPKRIIPKSYASPSLLSHILISKYVDHLPLDRQERMFKRLGVSLSKSTMSDWMGKVHQALNPLLDTLKKKMLQARVLNCDETTLKVQRNSTKKGSKTGYIWSYIGDERWVWFRWSQGRGGVNPLEDLKSFSGEYLQSDGYAGYNALVNDKKIKHLGCWAHARRKFVDAYKVGALQAEAVIKLIGNLYKIEKDAREENLSAETIRQLRQNKSKLVLAKIKEEVSGLVKNSAPKGKLGQALTYINSQWDHLVLYCEDGALSIDNNIVERAIRPIALGRKNYLFAGSEAGAEWLSGFYSLIETCKLQGVEPAEYLSSVLQIIAERNAAGDSLEDLLPDEWLKLKQKLLAENK
jgi:transposase